MLIPPLRALVAFLVPALFAGCAAIPDPLNDTTWRDPAYKGPGFARIFVVGLSAQSLVDQRGLENQLVSALQNAGVTAMPGWQFVPPGSSPDEATMRAAVARAGADAMLLVRMAPPTTETAVGYVSGVETQVAPNMYVGVYAPGFVSEDYQASNVYVTLFNVANEQQVWTYNPPVFGPGVFQQQAPAFAAEVAGRLLSNGLLRTF